MHVNVEPLGETERAELLTGSTGGLEVEQRWAERQRFLFAFSLFFFAINVCGLNFTFLCTQSGKAD